MQKTKSEERCGTCKHFDARLKHDGKRIRERDQGHRPCRAPAPALPALPQSVTMAWGFQAQPWGPGNRSFVGVNDGNGCPTWQASE